MACNCGYGVELTSLELDSQILELLVLLEQGSEFLISCL